MVWGARSMFTPSFRRIALESRLSSAATFSSSSRKDLPRTNSQSPRRIFSRSVSAHDVTDPPSQKLQFLEPPFTSLIDPSPSARPPHLKTITRKPNASAIEYYVKFARAYLDFYKHAIEAIYGNYKLSRKLRARLSAPPSSSPSSPSQKQNLEDAVISGNLSRAEYQLLRRTREDSVRLPFFFLVFGLCGEFTPLVVITFSNIVPRTAWIPKQVAASRVKIESRRQEPMIATSHGNDGGVSRLKDLLFAPQISQDLAALKRAAQHLGLYGAFWDRYLSVFGGPPGMLIRGRYERRKREILVDDMALCRDADGPAVSEGLADEEVRMACERRGISVCDRGLSDLRSGLNEWVRSDLSPNTHEDG